MIRLIIVTLVLSFIIISTGIFVLVIDQGLRMRPIRIMAPAPTKTWTPYPSVTVDKKPIPTKRPTLRPSPTKPTKTPTKYPSLTPTLITTPLNKTLELKGRGDGKFGPFYFAGRYFVDARRELNLVASFQGAIPLILGATKNCKISSWKYWPSFGAGQGTVKFTEPCLAHIVVRSRGYWEITISPK